MCLPLGCLKAIVSIGAAVSILISLALLVITIFANLSKKAIIDRASEGLINDALIGLYIASIIFLLLGICGLYGSLKGIKKKATTQAKCLLSVYSIGVVLFLLLFLGGTIFFFIGPETIFGTDCTSGSKVTLIADLYNLNKNASQFCTTDCPCYLNTTTLENSYLSQYLSNNSKIASNDLDKSTIKYQNCSGFDPKNQQLAITMATMQQLLQCAGWCPDDLRFYKFTDIQNCVSQECITSLEGCHQKFQDFMKDKGNLLGLSCLAALAVCAINLMAVCCICFHPTRTGKSRNFYQRMMETE